MVKREENRLARRRAILKVAGRSFLENGYAATTMSAIACEIGGSKGTLWSHFSTKEDLFSSFVEQRSADFWPDLVELLTPGRPVGAAIESFARRFIERLVQPESLQFSRLLIGESGRFPEIGRLFAERMARPLEDLLESFFRYHMTTGSLRHDDARAAARTVLNLCLGFTQGVLWGEVVHRRSAIAAEANRICRIAIAYYAPPSGHDLRPRALRTAPHAPCANAGSDILPTPSNER